MADTESRVFEPLDNYETDVVLMVPRKQFGRLTVEQAVRALAPRGDARTSLDAHFDFLLRRARGDLLFEWPVPRGAREKGIAILRDRWGVPTYTSDLGEGGKVDWTLDIFNPCNHECRLPIYDPNFEYLEVLLSRYDISVLDVSDVASRPHNLGRYPGDLSHDDIVARYEHFCGMLRRLYEAVQPVFMFGSAGNAIRQLYCLCLAYHFGRSRQKPSPKRKFWDFWWQFAIYPPSLFPSLPKPFRAFLEAHSEGGRIQSTGNHPADAYKVINVERLPDGAYLVWTPYNWPNTFDAYCAKTAGLLSILSVDIRARD